MSKEYTDDDTMSDKERAALSQGVFLKETNWMPNKLVKKYPEIKKNSRRCYS